MAAQKEKRRTNNVGSSHLPRRHFQDHVTHNNSQGELERGLAEFGAGYSEMEKANKEMVCKATTRGKKQSVEQASRDYTWRKNIPQS